MPRRQFPRFFSIFFDRQIWRTYLSPVTSFHSLLIDRLGSGIFFFFFFFSTRGMRTTSVTLIGRFTGGIYPGMFFRGIKLTRPSSSCRLNFPFKVPSAAANDFTAPPRPISTFCWLNSLRIAELCSRGLANLAYEAPSKRLAQPVCIRILHRWRDSPPFPSTTVCQRVNRSTISLIQWL